MRTRPAMPKERSDNNNGVNSREARSDENSSRRPRREPRPPSRYEPTMEGKSYPSERTALFQDMTPVTAHTHDQQ